MKLVRRLLLAGFIGTMVLVVYTQSTSAETMRHIRRDLHQDRRDLRQDRRDLKGDIKTGETEDLKSDVGDLKSDHADLKADRAERKAKREAWAKKHPEAAAKLRAWKAAHPNATPQEIREQMKKLRSEYKDKEDSSGDSENSQN